jgi:hypothetical protein
MMVKAKKIPNTNSKTVNDWYGSIIDKEWDDYEINSSFLVEEPFSAPKPNARKFGSDSEIYWLVESRESDNGI